MAAAAAAAAAAPPGVNAPAAAHALPLHEVNQIGEAWLVSRPDPAQLPVLAGRYDAPDAPYSPGEIGFFATAPMGAAAAAGPPPPDGWIPRGRIMTAGPRRSQLGPVDTTFLDTTTDSVPLCGYHAYLDPPNDKTNGELPLPAGFPVAASNAIRALHWRERLAEGQAELQPLMALGLPLDPLHVMQTLYHAAGTDAPLDPPGVQLTPGARSGGQALGVDHIHEVLASLAPGDAWWGPRAWLLRVGAHMGDGAANRRAKLFLGYAHVSFAGGGERKWFMPNLTTMRTFFDAARLTGDNVRGAHVIYATDWIPGDDECKRYKRCTIIQCSRAWPGTRTIIVPASAFVFANSLSVLLALLGFTVSVAGGAVPTRVPPPLFVHWVRHGATLDDLRVLGFGCLVTDGCARMSCQSQWKSAFKQHPPHANLAVLGEPDVIDHLPNGSRGTIHYIEFTNTCLELATLVHDVCARLGLPVCAVHLRRPEGWMAVMGTMCPNVPAYRVVCVDVLQPALGSVLWPALFF